MRSLSTAARGLRSARRGLAFARELLQEPITPVSARAAVRARLAERSTALLDTLRRTVFEHPGSPYRPLLAAAGYDLARLRPLVGAAGVESALDELRAAGIYVSIEEFKGLTETRRGKARLRLAPEDFDNPLTAGGFVASSGATRSRGNPTRISAANLRLGAEHLALALDAYGLADAPVVVWLPTAHGASLWAVLALLAIGKPPPHWFAQFPPPGRIPGQLRPFQLGLRAGTRRHGLRFPWPTVVPLGAPLPIVRWLVAGAPHRRGVLTTPSSALRLARAARQAGTGLAGATFVTIGEPLTPAKLAGIEAAGAQAYSSLGFTEFGRATYGCAVPGGPDDMHVCGDAGAVGWRRRPAGRAGVEVDALLFTSLRPDARKILLNVETGDYARMLTGSCGCPLEALGWRGRLADVRSFENLNAEGARLFGSELVGLIEEMLPGRFGGDPTDYQLLEEEDGNGFTRLSIVVHPRLGPVDEPAVIDCLREALTRLPEPSPPGELWAAAGTLQVRRQAPALTRAGKLLPLHLGAGWPRRG